MKQNGIAVALGLLALVIVATGTAVAVTATQVNIADPTTPSRVAHVDSSGRLTTVAVASSINSSTTFGEAGTNPLTSPTTATLAVSRLVVQNGGSNSAVEFELVRTSVSGGTCGGADQILADENVPSGGTQQDLYPVPLTVRATASAPYCIAVVVFAQSGIPLNVNESLGLQLTAYVAGGSYTGTGTGSTPAGAAVAGRKRALHAR